MKRKKNRSTRLDNRKSDVMGIGRFILIYLILMGVFFFLMSFIPIKSIIDIDGLYTESIVFITSKVLGAIGIPSSFHGSLIQLPSISLDVKFGCNGLEAVIIYSIAVLTFPTTWKKRAAGVIAGFFVIQVINFFRIVALAYFGVYHRDLFDVIHIYVAQGLMIAISLGVFLFYLYYLNHGEKEGEALS